MRKNLVGFFFFFSLGGNGSFLSIKDAVTCLQHHVGCNFIRTRNFCQLIFPCSGCRALCRVCLWLAALSCAIPWVWGWQQNPAVCRDNQDVSPDCLVLLLPFGLCRGISGGGIVLADTPLARAQCPGKGECFQDFQVAEAVVHVLAIPSAPTLPGSQMWEGLC